MGYVICMAVPSAHPELKIAAVVTGIAILSLATWRYIERPAQQRVKGFLTEGLSKLDHVPNSISGSGRL
jgi:hypothetical protein